jgi:hypothetical protein
MYVERFDHRREGDQRRLADERCETLRRTTVVEDPEPERRETSERRADACRARIERRDVSERREALDRRRIIVA